MRYNPFRVYCRELAPGTVSLTGDRAQGDDGKHDSHYRHDDLSTLTILMSIEIEVNNCVDMLSTIIKK